MNDPATTRQKQFLRRLGHKEIANLSKTQASGLIGQLLEQGTTIRQTVPLPILQTEIRSPTKANKEMPTLWQEDYHITGRFLTEEQVAELNQKEWLKDERTNVKDNIRDDWKGEREFRREFGEAGTVGYMLKIGPDCPHAAHLNGTIVMLEDAKEHPDMLPPYDECQHDTCQCEYEPVSANEVPRGARVAELAGTKPKRPRQQQKSGCATVLLTVVGVVAIVYDMLA